MTRVKICGISAIDHAIAAAEAGTDFIGLVFAASPRRVTQEKAAGIVSALKQARIKNCPKVVGVFVNAPAVEVNRLAQACQLDYVQLSGDEPWDYVKSLRMPVIKAVHIGPAAGSGGIEAELRKGRSLGVICLLDTKAREVHGGSGKTFDWSIVKALSGRYDFLLAGGLTPDNVGEALALVYPWGVDVSSGVETKGVKDMRKIKAFIDASRASHLPAIDRQIDF